ncbi:MAG: hypothetical protein HRU09_13015 [Oligoflexales bacterium]|nr:hypothetical protein [Oligoflexales bacterium]
MVLNHILSKSLLILFFLCSSVATLGAQKNSDDHKLFKYSVVISELPKEIKELEKSVAQLRKSYGKNKAKEIETSNLLKEAVVKVSSLDPNQAIF